MTWLKLPSGKYLNMDRIVAIDTWHHVRDSDTDEPLAKPYTTVDLTFRTGAHEMHFDSRYSKGDAEEIIAYADRLDRIRRETAARYDAASAYEPEY